MPAIVRTKAHRAFISVVVACRREAGLTQAELAARCKKPQSWIAQLESGQKGFQVGELPLLAKGLGIPMIKLCQRYAVFLKA